MRTVFSLVVIGWLGVCAATLAAGAAARLGTSPGAQELLQDELPSGGSPPALTYPYFPDRLHTFVFRNWELVDPAKMAAVVGASPDQIVSIGDALGLPPPREHSEPFRQRSYLTVLRRNWHLLPYQQLLQLLDKKPAELAEILREDDFLFIKLGQLKPACEPLRWEAPNDEALRRSAEIQQELRETLGEDWTNPGVPRFDFLRKWAVPTSPDVGDLATPDGDSTDDEGRFATRFIYSYVALFGDPLLDERLDPFPDGLLAELARVGVNGVWLHVVLRDLAPGGPTFPEFGRDHEKRLANLRRLALRARRYGIGIYLYQNEPRAMPSHFFRPQPELAGVTEGDFTALCTSTPEVRQWLRNALAHVFREVPELAGVFTITASENLTNCASHGQQHACPRCRLRTEAEIIAEVNAAIREGVQSSQPQARVIAWDWGWNRHGDATAHIDLLPKGIELMSVSEWNLPLDRGGVRSQIGEYSLSAVGPGPRALRHWQQAQARGLGAFAKVQFNNSWELAAVPYLPVLDLVAQHCRKLATAGVDGLMLSWSLGGYPSLNLEVAQRFNLQPQSDVDQVLTELALRHYGIEGGPLARAAWRELSAAFQQYPYDGSLVYHGPQLLGPSNPLYLAPTGYRATMTGFPYDDLAAWRGIYPAPVFLAQFERVAGGWGHGVDLLRQAVAAAPVELHQDAQADLRVAEAAECHFKSVVNQTRFVLLRDQWRDLNLPAQQHESLRRQLREVVTAELELATRLWRLTQQDSRIGFEASNQYLYVPLDLAEKVVNCRWVLRQLAE